MKEFFAPAKEARLALSCEEEAILVDEIGAAHNTIQQTADELNQSEDMAESLEDVLIVVDHVKAAPNEQTVGLVSSVSDMAGAGMDVEDVIADPTLSNESIQAIKDTLKRIWDSILGFLKRMWTQVNALFNKYELLFNNYRDKIEAALEEIKKIKTDGPSENDEVTVQNAVTSHQDKGAQEATKWAGNWDDVNVMLRKTLSSGLKENAAYGKMVRAFADKLHLDPKASPNHQTMADGQVQQLAQDFVKQLGSMKSDLAHVGQDEVMNLAHDLPGMTDIYFNVGEVDENATGDKTLQVLRALSHGHFSLTQSLMHQGQLFKMPTTAEAKEVLYKTMGACTFCLDYLSKGKKAVEDISKAMQVSIDRVVKDSNAAPQTTLVKQYVTALMQLNKHFDLATTGFSNDVLRYVARQVGSTEIAMNHCLTVYRKGEAVVK